MIDIHSHILPSLDDGSQSLEQSVAMLRIAQEQGIRAIIATPHYHGPRKSAPPAKVRERIALLQERIISEHMNIALYPGNEIFYHREVEEELEKGQVNTLAGSRYVLVEFHPTEEYSYISAGLNNLCSYGYYPILAHTERYEALFDKKELYHDIKNSGVKFQINASSVTAKGFGNVYRKRAMQLLKEKMADHIATDAHSDNHRAPMILECEKILKKKAGEVYTRKLLVGNAEHILRKGNTLNTLDIIQGDI